MTSLSQGIATPLGTHPNDDNRDVMAALKGANGLSPTAAPDPERHQAQINMKTDVIPLD